MKSLVMSSYVIGVAMLAALTTAHAQQPDPAKEAEKTIRDFLEAMSSRDAASLRSLMDKQLVAIEAGQTSAKVGFVDTTKDKELLPPQGNDDWDKDKVRLSSIKVEISATHPSVAMVSFTLTFPLTDQRVADLEAGLKQAPGEFDEEQTKGVRKIIADRAIHNSMFAMLAREGGKWKIVCISVPK